MYVSKIKFLFGGGVNVLGFLTKLWTELSFVLTLFAWYSINRSFLQNFLTSVFSSVISARGVGVNFKPCFVKLRLNLREQIESSIESSRTDSIGTRRNASDYATLILNYIHIALHPPLPCTHVAWY